MAELKASVPNGSGELTDERTPLLAASPAAPTVDPDVAPATTAASNSHSDTEDDERPLPRMQIFLLCCTRVVEPIACFSILPFVNQMVQEAGDLSEANVGFYSGLIESCFSLTQMACMLFWGRASDRYGRKPVLTISLFGTAFTVAMFGFATTPWQMIVFRCVAGIFSGTIVTVRTMVSEISTARTQARAFSFFAFAGNMGIFLGPLLGGALAEPARQYGGVFRTIPLFKEYPYALATIAAGCIGLVSAILSLFFIRETNSIKIKPDPESSTLTSSPSSVNNNTSAAPTSILGLLRHPGVGIVIYLYAHVMLLAFAWTVLSPVFWYTPIDQGGCNFRPFDISMLLATVGVAQAIWLLVIFPPLQKRFGTSGVLNITGFAYPFFILTAPIGNILLRQHHPATTTAFWIFMPVATAIGTGVSMAFTAVQLALNDISPSPQTLGTLNAVALMIISGLRAFAPVAFSSIFAVGIRTQFLYGYLVWIILIVLAVMFGVAVHWLPEKANGKLEPKNKPGSSTTTTRS